MMQKQFCNAVGLEYEAEDSTELRCPYCRAERAEAEVERLREELGQYEKAFKDSRDNFDLLARKYEQAMAEIKRLNQIMARSLINSIRGGE